jgi:hypothetical protein
MTARPSGLGKAVLAAIGVRLILVPIFMVANRAIFTMHLGIETYLSVIRAENVVRALVTALIAILFMIWVRAEIVSLRSTGIQTKTTPLMAILGWFIPFANFVFPVLGMREVYKLRLPRASAALPVVWWVAYLVSMVTNNVALPFPIGLIVTLVAFGSWFAVVWQVVMAPAQPTFGAAPCGPQPYAPHEPHPQPAPYYAPPRM